jgi:hypothetical protein
MIMAPRSRAEVSVPLVGSVGLQQLQLPVRTPHEPPDHPVVGGLLDQLPSAHRHGLVGEGPWGGGRLLPPGVPRRRLGARCPAGRGRLVGRWVRRAFGDLPGTPGLREGRESLPPLGPRGLHDSRPRGLRCPLPAQPRSSARCIPPRFCVPHAALQAPCRNPGEARPPPGTPRGRSRGTSRVWPRPTGCAVVVWVKGSAQAWVWESESGSGTGRVWVKAGSSAFRCTGRPGGR